MNESVNHPVILHQLHSFLLCGKELCFCLSLCLAATGGTAGGKTDVCGASSRPNHTKYKWLANDITDGRMEAAEGVEVKVRA